ncbi:DUF2064 domain-containing protein [Ulvibacterium marinum]|uniref:DUF2064 domain-containing protein n=1 Tax=Ulvibacterium marinum TaxID=2419782 RepID=UPI0013149A2C|nr:DUF2064 domain-containing protein [Ulvibacterium marinum]
MVFALSDEEEVKRKPFLAQDTLAKSLNKHTKDIAVQSDLPVFHFDETKQIGDDFGTRFSNAIRSVFDEGYDGLIAIGNDCPYLQVNHIHQAKAILENGEAVLGPTYDGGFYLMGLSKKDFDYRAFLTLSWNTNKIFEEFFESLKTRRIECHSLEKLWDINYLSALENLVLHRIRNARLRSSIQSAVKRRSTNYFVSKVTELKLLHFTLFNKGSPVFYFFQS